MSAGVKVGRSGRFLLSLGDDGVLLHFLDHHFVARSLKERIARSVARLSVGMGLEDVARGLLVRPAHPDVDWQCAVEGVERAFERSGLDPSGRWILLQDYRNKNRFRTVAFGFTPRGREPVMVVKVRPALATGPALRREWKALREVRKRLPEGLRQTVPETIAYFPGPETEVMATSWLSGRSPYVDVRNLLRRGRRVARHLRAASRWLSDFQEATELGTDAFEGGAGLPEAEELAEGVRGKPTAPDPLARMEWYDDLRERLLARRALLDGEPPPGGIDLVQRVRDILRRALRGHGAIVAARVTLTFLPSKSAGLPVTRASGQVRLACCLAGDGEGDPELGHLAHLCLARKEAVPGHEEKLRDDLSADLATREHADD